MDMLVMGLCFTFFCLAITAMAFAAATRPEGQKLKPQPEYPAVTVAPAHFFSNSLKPCIPTTPIEVPIEVLLQQIEHHVRLEQAAVESFVAFPTHALLHSKTTSPFVN